MVREKNSVISAQQTNVHLIKSLVTYVFRYDYSEVVLKDLFWKKKQIPNEEWLPGCTFLYVNSYF